MKIEHIQKIEDLINAYEFLENYFKSYELVNISDFIFYARNYSILHKDEGYFVYVIRHNDEIKAVLSFVKLKEFISVDYLAISKDIRICTKDIINSIINILKEYDIPIICEAESDVLVRLYKMIGFNKFDNNYSYYILKNGKISSHHSNLMYYGDNLDFNDTRRILFNKHYLRWNSIYGESYIKEYKRILEKFN